MIPFPTSHGSSVTSRRGRVGHVSFSALTLALSLASYTVDGRAAAESGVCTVQAPTLSEARRAYAARCELPRLDCDPLGAQWTCSSHRIGSAAPGRATAPAPAPARPVPESPTPPVVPGRRSGACEVTGPTLKGAKKRYAERCSDARRDCDAIDGAWMCASYRIGSAAPGSVASRPPVTPTPSPVTPTAPDTPPAASGTLRAEAEFGTLGAGWRREGGHIIWRGRPDRYNLAQRRDDANIAYRLNVPTAGRYRFTMRSAALEGPNPAEPANDVWVTFGQVPWTKAYMPRNRAWHVAATGERAGRHSPALLESDLPAGPVTLTISGRSTGHAIDWVGLDRVGGASAPVPVTDPVTDPSGDLLVLHFDSSYDPDDLQAMVASRVILDRYPDREVMVVNATRSYKHDGVVPGSLALARSLFPDTIDALGDRQAENKVAAAWQLTLEAGHRVLLAEGGPSDFTARVLKILRSRDVKNLRNIRVVQHSHGWNEENTRPENVRLVQSLATYIRIDDGNRANRTPDYLEAYGAAGSSFRRRALATRYGPQWRTAFDAIDSSKRGRSVDFSDTVELLHVLGIPTSAAPDVTRFADRYFR